MALDLQAKCEKKSIRKVFEKYLVIETVSIR